MTKEEFIKKIQAEMTENEKSPSIAEIEKFYKAIGKVAGDTIAKHEEFKLFDLFKITYPYIEQREKKCNFVAEGKVTVPAHYKVSIKSLQKAKELANK